MTHHRSSLGSLGMEPFEHLKQLPDMAVPPALDARVRRRLAEFHSPRSAPAGRVENAINALVVGSYMVYALGELTRILFG